jgi:hypothetical protein
MIVTDEMELYIVHLCHRHGAVIGFGDGFLSFEDGTDVIVACDIGEMLQDYEDWQAGKFWWHPFDLKIKS